MQDQTIPAPPQTHQPWPNRPMPGLSPRPEQATNPQAQRQQEQAQQQVQQ